MLIAIKTVQDLIFDQSFNNKTGIVYDPFMLLHKSESYETYDDSPDRMQIILDNFEQQKIFSNKNVRVIKKVTQIQRQHLLAVHSEKYINFIENIWPPNPTYGEKEIFVGETVFNKNTKQAAFIAANASLVAIDKIMKKEWKNAFVIVRPPGHHSGYMELCAGYCVFNNVVIAAKYAQKKYNLKKIAVIDWDIHHGDGSQYLLQDDPNIAFFSFHRYDNAQYYPCNQTASEFNIGKDKGKGFNFNIPWNTLSENGYQEVPGTDDYIYGFERIIMPVLREFKPDLILVSSGFDSGLGDPLGYCKLEREGFAYMTQRLKNEICSNLIVLFEGGYSLETIKVCSESVVRALMGETFPLKNFVHKVTVNDLNQNCCPSQFGYQTIQRCLEVFQQNWSCLNTDKEGLLIEKTVNENLDKMYKLLRKDFIIKDELLYKPLKNQREKIFFENIVKSNKKLESIVPEYIKTDKLNGNQYLVFKNLLHNKQNISFVRFMIGDDLNTQDTYRLTDFVIRNKDGGLETCQFYDFSLLNEQNDKKKINQILNQLFSTLNKEQQIEVQQRITNCLENLKKYLIGEDRYMQKTFTFTIIVDNNKNICDFKVFDLQHSHIQYHSTNGGYQKANNINALSAAAVQNLSKLIQDFQLNQNK